MSVEKIVSELCEFVEYVYSFYNEKDGVYPIKGLTDRMILTSTEKYFQSMNNQITWGGGDSLDRERVRDIILEEFQLEMN